jgi:hypothetical protein
MGPAQLAGIGQQVYPNWSLSICDIAGVDQLIVPVRLTLSADGRLVGAPAPVSPRSDPVYRAAAESAVRAVRATSPFTVPAGFTQQELTFRFRLDQACRGR